MAAPRLKADEEAELLRGARSSSAAARDAACKRLFEAFRAPVLSMCLHVTGRQDVAEDALQECFLSVFGALPRFRGDARLSTWIYRIAVREALRQRARHGRREAAPIDDERVAASSVGNPARRRETREAFRRAWDDLSAEHRTVLSLFAADGLSHKEIADVLGVPQGTVWSRLHAARKRLARAMDPVR